MKLRVDTVVLVMLRVKTLVMAVVVVVMVIVASMVVAVVGIRMGVVWIMAVVVETASCVCQGIPHVFSHTSQSTSPEPPHLH